MKYRRDNTYIWVTWLSKLITGEQPCEWVHWLKANYDGYEKIHSDFDAVAWQIEHTRMLREMRVERMKHGGKIFIESQNSFKYKTKEGIAVGGKPDMIEIKEGNTGIIYDAKTGRQLQSNQAQVMLYQYLVPLARPEWESFTFNGSVCYKDNTVDIPCTAIDSKFKDNVNYYCNLLASKEPLQKMPCEANCRFCDIPIKECPERVDAKKE
jgi:hypothetical protein